MEPDKIAALRAEAVWFGDDLQAAICTLALSDRQLTADESEALADDDRDWTTGDVAARAATECERVTVDRAGRPHPRQCPCCPTYRPRTL